MAIEPKSKHPAKTAGFTNLDQSAHEENWRLAI
jgi:hypothetical protein